MERNNQLTALDELVLVYFWYRGRVCTGSMQKTNEVAKKLSDAVKEIGLTINIIDEISSSTNLLALNASIEAARAGEAGKGFANISSMVESTMSDVGRVTEQVNVLNEMIERMNQLLEQR